MTAKYGSAIHTLRATGLDLIRDLEASGAATPVSLKLADHQVSFDQYEALAAMFGSIKLSCSWWIGDLLNWGEKVYGESYAQVAELTGLQVDTLRHYCYVCRCVAMSRRRADLSFGHHRQVAPLEPAEQTFWLKAAAEKGWSKAGLERAMREAERLEEPSEQPQWSEPPPEAPAPATGLWARLRPATSESSGDTLTVTVNGKPLVAELATTSPLAEAARRVVESANLDPGHHWYVVDRDAIDALASLLAEE